MSETRDIYESFAEEVPFGVVLLDRARRAIFWNRRAEQITGYYRHEIVGRNCYELAVLGCERRQNCTCQGADCPLASLAAHQERVSAVRFLLQHKKGHRISAWIDAIHLLQSGGGLALVFQEKGSEREMRLWMLQGHQVDAEFGLPSVAATLDYVSLSVGQKNTAFALIEIEEAEQMARHFGRELLNVVIRNLVRSISQFIGVPHFLGHWGGGRLLLILPNCTLEFAEAVAAEIREPGEKYSVRWWGDLVTSRVRAWRVALQEGEAPESFIQRLEESREAPQQRSDSRCS